MSTTGCKFFIISSLPESVQCNSSNKDSKTFSGDIDLASRTFLLVFLTTSWIWISWNDSKIKKTVFNGSNTPGFFGLFPKNQPSYPDAVTWFFKSKFRVDIFNSIRALKTMLVRWSMGLLIVLITKLGVFQVDFELFRRFDWNKLKILA